MSDTDDDDVLFALRPMSAVSATTLITTSVADADATKHSPLPPSLPFPTPFPSPSP